MTSDVLNGVAMKLKPLGMNIEFESVDQGFEVPCFYIRIVRTSKEHHFNGRYLRECDVLVQYFPQDTMEPRQEILEMEERLYDLLSKIKLQTITVSGQDMRTREVDETLQMEVTYRYAVTETEKKEAMETWQIDQTVRNPIVPPDMMGHLQIK